MPTVLILEDDPDIRRGVSQHFSREGVNLIECETGREALAALTDRQAPLPDAAILDLTLPDIDGLEILRIIRSHPALRGLPVIVVTARSEELDRVLGLELGADDYVSKPFSIRELGARVRAVIRRGTLGAEAHGKMDQNQLISHGPLRVNLEGYVVHLDGVKVDMTRREFELLVFLVRNTGRVLTRDVLLKEVWGLSYGGETRTVDAHIRRLRAKLGVHEHLIETVIGVGYKLRPTNPE